MLPDGQGSVRQLANSVGEVTDTYRYDAYGNLLSHTGTTVLPYGYDGQRLDSTSGLYQLRAREYDPTTGRFTSPDSASLSPTDTTELDRYVYAGANPSNNRDPSGHDLEGYLPDALTVPVVANTVLDLATSAALNFLEVALYEALPADDAAEVFGWVVKAVAVLRAEPDLIRFLHWLQQFFLALISGSGPSGTGWTGGPGGGGGGTGGGGGGPAPRGAMRVQVQEQVGSKTVTHSSKPLFGPGGGAGVTTADAIAGLTAMRAAVPSGSKAFRTAADQALANAIKWVLARPPNGICTGGFSKSFYWDNKVWRFDIENIFGCNLLV